MLWCDSSEHYLLWLLLPAATDLLAVVPYQQMIGSCKSRQACPNHSIVLVCVAVVCCRELYTLLTETVLLMFVLLPAHLLLQP
jgi:hypothetical protein